MAVDEHERRIKALERWRDDEHPREHRVEREAERRWMVDSVSAVERFVEALVDKLSTKVDENTTITKQSLEESILARNERLKRQGAEELLAKQDDAITTKREIEEASSAARWRRRAPVILAIIAALGGLAAAVTSAIVSHH
jgi:hypothetical protein